MLHAACSFCLHNFAATVTITPSPGSEVLLVPHPIFDGAHFASLEALNSHSEQQVSLACFIIFFLHRNLIESWG